MPVTLTAGGEHAIRRRLGINDMTMKTNGLALKTFYADARFWARRDGQPLYWVDDFSLTVNGAHSCNV